MLTTLLLRHKEVNKPKLDINWENMDLTSIIETERIESAMRLKERIEGLQDQVVHGMEPISKPSTVS